LSLLSLLGSLSSLGKQKHLIDTYDMVAKSLHIVMPDVIRHPEHIEYTGFRLSPA